MNDFLSGKLIHKEPRKDVWNKVPVHECVTWFRTESFETASTKSAFQKRMFLLFSRTLRASAIVSWEVSPIQSRFYDIETMAGMFGHFPVLRQWLKKEYTVERRVLSLLFTKAWSYVCAKYTLSFYTGPLQGTISGFEDSNSTSKMVKKARNPSYPCHR